MTSTTIDTSVDRVLQAIHGLKPSRTRHLIAIAGPPASGKSTLAESVRDALIRSGTPCGFVPMDGFHYDNTTLERRGLLARKGAPETFDAVGFCTLIDRLTREDSVAVPLFDRETDRVLSAASYVEARQRHVIVEGNYLFLKDDPWSALDPKWSLKIFLDTPLDVLEDRLIQRWLRYGLTPSDAKAKATANDMVNARTVLNNSNRSNVAVRL